MKHRVGFTDDELLRIVRLLHKVALSRTRCPDKANDLVQNTVLRMLDKKYQFEAGTVLGGCDNASVMGTTVPSRQA